MCDYMDIGADSETFGARDDAKGFCVQRRGTADGLLEKT